ncbi:MAG: TetR/AcrR family transcriptional regulator [Dehalococcoidia bacterium]|uniref:TetR/AcrR family transcriptional regulator n=1 Tax=Candidatus Amarobacter glycogenicus TaxID=3140699 RepID=UPI003134DD3F|nr:TetR/AcrR family transcriptional regulator [Dehalococcoidia bacterium]
MRYDIVVATAPGRLERRKARTRASIITAASKLFHERGYEETSIQHIAELADTGVGTLYGYFSSKDEILREVLQTERDEALDRYFASIDRTTPYMERACMAVLALAAYLRNNRTILTAAFQVSARNRQIDESQAEWLHAGFRDMVQAGVAAGEFRDLPLDATVRMLVGTIMLAMLGIGNWAGEDEKPELPETLVTLTRAILAR